MDEKGPVQLTAATTDTDATGYLQSPATLHPSVEERVYKLLGIPADIKIHCCLPMGYPRGNFGPTSRLPSQEITHYNGWDQSPPW